MDKYIKALLISDSRAIIPQFGAIQALRENNISLSFNPYLNFDDGKLAELMANREGTTKTQAAERVAETVKQYNARLDAGEPVVLEGIGTIRKDEGGHIEFEAVPDYTETSVAEVLGLIPNLPKKELGKKAGRALEEAQKAMTDEAAETETGTNTDAAANANGDEENKEEEKVSFRPKTAPVAEPANDGDERRRRMIIIIIILLLLLLLGFFGYFFLINKDNAVRNFFMGKPAVEAPAALPADTATVAPADTAAVVEPEPAPEPAAPAPTAAQPLTKRYNIIVGSHKDESTAIKQVDNLKAKGFKDAFVGIKKDRFVAVIGSFNNITEAEKMQEDIVDGPYHIESWMTNSGENVR